MGEETDDLEIEEDSQKDKFLTFRIGEEGYGLDIRHITEIIGIQKITPVPDMPDYVVGVINLRGTVIPIMNVRRRFGLPLKDYDPRTCIIVVNLEETSLGLIVDEVSEVLTITEDCLEPPPRVSRGPNSRFIQGLGKVGNEARMILDTKKILYDGEPARAGSAEQE
ncbi:MAG: purine-binding chemotaxis protein CheW [Nitrospinae bacterium]|nr:purine-binding chemotaxis protein CheW [Nitrospinota bacterium]MBF0634892.1 purine-binding chemotaxis protein CheW [Nitrospinota bacterium]